MWPWVNLKLQAEIKTLSKSKPLQAAVESRSKQKLEGLFGPSNYTVSIIDDLDTGIDLKDDKDQSDSGYRIIEFDI